MPLDTFICGSCQDSFSDLNEFVTHKQRNCANPQAALSDQGTDLSQGTEVIQLHMNESGEITSMMSEPIREGEGGVASGATLAFLNDVNIESELSRTGLEAAQQGDDSATTHLIILNSSGADGSVGVDGSTMTLLDNSSGLNGMPGLGTMKTETLPDLIPHQQKNTEQDKQATPPPKKKRVGRSKTGEGKTKTLEAVPPTTRKPTVPETNADGKLVCPQCKRTFTKERHFNTHKCLATSSYVDITKKEIVKLDSDEEEAAGELELDAGAQDDEEDEFTAPVDENVDAEKEEEDDEKEMDKEEGVEKEEGTKKKKRGRKRKRSSYQFDIAIHDENSGARQMKMAAESMENLPIFKNDDDKTEFEACVDVDLSQVDHMFRIHIIEQELNEMSGMVYNTPTMSSLSVYSCNLCEKVFKSLSHIRLHCITHTDIKPFKCNKCTYSTNSKGNLYTHMRKHTGQFYRCDRCDFKTVNKSHLVEHQMTHDNRRSQCAMCQKDYSTLKSLINHIRKYHTDKRGKEYLQTFLQGRGVKGTTVIHQCHVCNRKFKKRIDRDRHLFIHDIKDLRHVQQCELCDYWASRRVYLDKHYLKHRVIYCCAVCDSKFLSTTRLAEHLTAAHSDQAEKGTCVADALLEACIKKSLYLPEPLATTKEGSKYVNLPEELRESSQSSQPQNKVNLSTNENPESKAENAPIVDPGVKIALENSPSTNEQSGDFPAEYRQFIGENSSHEQEETKKFLTKDSAGASDKEMVELAQETSEFKDSSEISASKLAEETSQENTGETTTNNLKGSEVVGENEPQSGVTVKTEPVGNTPEKNMPIASPLLMLQNPGSDSDMEEEETANDKENETSQLEDGSGEACPPEGGEELGDLVTGDVAGEKNADPELGETAREENPVPTDETSMEPSSNTDQMKVSANKEKKIEALIKRLGYRNMTMAIFNKMRETFGTEECEFCGRLFYSKVDYEPHLRTHTGDKPFACANCSFRATTKDQLKKHSEREHEKVAFQCKECDFLAPTRTRLWNHQLKHLGISGLSCPQCPNKFDGMKQLRAHILNTHQDMDRETLEKLTGYRHKPLGKMGRRSFKCPHCPRVFIRANSELQKHIWIHEGIKPFSCPICPYACRSKNNLQAHMLRHSAEKPFSCSECGKEYKSKTALRWHVRSHKTGKLFKCDKCPYEATQSSHLKRHMETHDVLKRFICKHCDFSANTLGYMKIHYAKHHKGKAFVHDEVLDQSMQSSEKRVYKCLSCGYLFGNLSDLKRHLKIRHHVQMQDIAGMEQLQISEVEVVQYEDESTVPTIVNQQIQPANQVVSGELQLEMANQEGTMPLSAANLIQQIIGMSQGESQVRVVNEDGEPFEISPETIIVQQDGQLLLTSDTGGMLPDNQYVIQYYNPGDMQTDSSVVGDTNSNTEVQLVASNQETLQLVTSEGQGGQVIMKPAQQQLLTSDGHIQIMTPDGQTQVITQDGDTSQLITINTEGQLLTSEGEGSQFVNNDLESYGNQLIISDPAEQEEGLVIGEATSQDDQEELPSTEVIDGTEG